MAIIYMENTLKLIFDRSKDEFQEIKNKGTLKQTSTNQVKFIIVEDLPDDSSTDI